MTLAPLIAASLAVGLPARTKGLYIDGLDVIKQPGAPGNLYGVPIDSIRLTEAGPGQVSSLQFTIDDPLGVLSIGLGQFVLYMDIARDVPLFAGYITTPPATSWGIGRRIDVQCIGLEALLDWISVGSVTIPAGTDAYVALSMIVAVCNGIGAPLRVSSFADGSGSSIATPISLGFGAVTHNAVTIANVPLRQALETLGSALLSPGQLASGFYAIAATVDFRGNLRTWFVVQDPSGNFIGVPDDYTGVTVSSASIVRAPADLSHRVTRGNAPRSVLVVGGNAAGSGLVGDGSGLIGPTAVVKEPNSTSANMLLSVGRQYLAVHGTAVAEGSVRAEENTTVGAPGAELRAGSTLTLTDAQVGLSSFKAPIAQIDKRFYPSGAEDWTITYGLAVRSGAALLRRLTRDTLS